MGNVDMPTVGRQFSIGDVFSLAMRSAAQHWLMVFAAFMLILLTSLASQFLMFPGAQATTPDSTVGQLVLTLLSFVANLVATGIAMALLTFAVVYANRGDRVDFGRAVGAAAKLALPVIGFSILWSLGVGLGFVLLIVPGIILATMWAVGVPALVVERTGVIEAFGRSRELTRGNRWKIFGILLIFVVAYYGLIFGLLGAVGFSATALDEQNFGADGVSPYLLLASGLAAMIYVLWGLISPAIYVALRSDREGADEDSLEEIFA